MFQTAVTGHRGQVLAHHDLHSDWGVSGRELELLAHHIEQRVGVELTDHVALADPKTIGQLVRAQLFSAVAH